MKIRLYRCDKTFVLEPIIDMLQIKEVYGMIVLDRRDANIALLKGKTIVHLLKTHSEVPGKMRAGGQCLVKDSIIQLHDGSLPKIELVHNPNIVKSCMITNNLSIMDSNITNKWTAKKDKIFKITTKNPRIEIQSSNNHVFFVSTSNGFIEKAAEELKEGDFLLMPEKIDVKGEMQKLNSRKYYNSFIINPTGQKLLKKKRTEKKLDQKVLAKQIGITQTTISSYEIGKINAKRTVLEKVCTALNINFDAFLKEHTIPSLYRDVKLPEELNEEFAQFLGYLLGDGCIEPDRITFFEQNKQVAIECKDKFDKFLGMISSYKFRESKNYHQLRFTSRPLVRLIKNEFPELKKALDSEIPEKVLKSPNNILAAFLKGIFDAECYVQNKRGIGLGINNKKLAQQIQLALLRFSIISSVHEYDNRANKYSKNPRFTVDITEKKSINIFKNYIGLTSSEKNRKLSSILATKSDMSRDRQIVMHGSRIRELVEKAGYNLQLFPKVSDFFRDQRMISKQAFESSILANIKDEKLYLRLKEICDYPVLPVKINKIEVTNKNTEMIDISVKNQNFIANGIIVHNSAHRFEMNRELAAKAHYNKVADYVKEQFLTMENLKGILVGGPGPTKYEFVDGNFITDQLKRKIIAIKDLGYTGEFGLQELLDRCQDVLAAEEVAKEKDLMNKFFNMLAKNSKKVSYGEKEVRRVLEMGAVDILLLCEDLPDAKIEEFEQIAEKYGTTAEIISTETREGVQLRDIGMYAAMLRYAVQD